jgi:hypothetical protein
MCGSRFTAKKKSARERQSAGGRNEIAPLNLLFLLGRERFLGGLRFGGALLEFVHAAGGIHELLLARIKRVANVADTHNDGLPGGAGLNDVAAGATNLRVDISRMYVRLHKKDVQSIIKTADDKRDFGGICDCGLPNVEDPPFSWLRVAARRLPRRSIAKAGQPALINSSLALPSHALYFSFFPTTAPTIINTPKISNTTPQLRLIFMPREFAYMTVLEFVAAP